MNKIDTYIWDWNGTLLHDVELSYELLNVLLTRHGYAKVNSVDEYKNIFCFPIEKYYASAGFDFAKNSYVELAKEYTQLYLENFEKCCVADEAYQILQELQRRGAKQIILSASYKNVLLQQLEFYKVSDFFAEILGLDNVLAQSKAQLGSEWIKKAKINRENCIMIGDTDHDAHTAKAMGIKCALYTGGHQSKQVLQGKSEYLLENLMSLLDL